MTDLNEMADRLHRTVKLALDTGEASGIEEAERIFAGYRLQIVVGADISQKPFLQAALLTAVNCAARTMLGGVAVVGAIGPLLVALRSYNDLAQAVAGLGGRLAAAPEVGLPTVTLGDVDAADLDPLAIRATGAEWCGGIVPATSHLRLSENGDFAPAGVLAGALAVSEVFQRLRGRNPMACRRTIGLDLWQLERDWRRGGAAAPLDRLPSAAWLVGLGNLGQAYIWTLGLLPYGDEAPELVLQDFDMLAPSNRSTSLLTTPDTLGRRKTRAMAVWAEARGFRTTIVERNFDANFRVAAREPSVALIGVDNALARQSIENVGFDRIIDAGLGGGPQDFLGIDLHTFPASKPAADIWRDVSVSPVDISQPAYSAILESSKDPCGTVRLAGRTIGAPFVGAAAAALVVAELVRLTMGASRYELVSCHLRDLGDKFVLKGAPWPAFNAGSVARAA